MFLLPFASRSIAVSNPPHDGAIKPCARPIIAKQAGMPKGNDRRHGEEAAGDAIGGSLRDAPRRERQDGPDANPVSNKYSVGNNLA